MVSEAIGGERDFSLGRVLSRTFATLGARPVPILLIALIFSALPKLLWGIASQRLAMSAATDFALVFLTTQGGSLIIRLVTGVILQGAVTWVTVEHASGERVPILDALRTAGRTMLPLIALALVIGVAVLVGLGLAIVPGVMMWVAWIVAAPALVAERSGVLAAMARSAALTKGVRWQVFGLELAVLAFALIIGAVVGIGGVLLGMRGGDGGLVTVVLVVTGLASTLAGALTATIQAALYVELRDWKDGPPEDHLAEIFA